MTWTFSFFSRVLDVIAPRSCVVCGRRLSMSERFLCAHCDLHLPRTDCAHDFYRNLMAQRFWGRVPVERAFAMVCYEPHAETAMMVYRLKYDHNPLLGQEMGQFVARELAHTDFFEGIDALVPVPLTRRRQHQRGYNQSLELARGIAQIRPMPIFDRVLERTSFGGTQTRKGRQERNENVEQAFRLADGRPLNGKHVLLVDDVVTTGATMIACIRQIMQAGDVQVSVLSWGLAGG